MITTDSLQLMMRKTERQLVLKVREPVGMHKKVISGSADTGRGIIAGQTADKSERRTASYKLKAGVEERVLFTDALQI